MEEYYGNIRESSKKQTQGYNLDAQKQHTKDWTKVEGMTVLDTYVKPCKSGKSIKFNFAVDSKKISKIEGDYKMNKIIYKSINPTGYIGTSIIYKNGHDYIQNTIYLDTLMGMKSSVRKLSIEDVAYTLATDFVYPPSNYEIHKRYSEIDESIKGLWSSIESIYINTMRAVEKNLQEYDRDIRRDIIFQSMVWYFQSRNNKKSGTSCEEMKLLNAMIKEFVYSKRLINGNYYEPEEYYSDNK